VTLDLDPSAAAPATRLGDSRFIGAGLGFPLRTTATGAVALVRGYAELEESMRLILGTAPGERPRRPEFGCGVHDLVFDAVDTELAGRVAAEVRAALLRWEPRVDVLAVRVAPDPDRPVVLIIDVEYAVRDTNDARNLVVPFYALPGEDA
jgi:phage baseplate assembly protein W